jgi:hypothetical protein
MLGNSLVAAQLAAPQEGLLSMELVCAYPGVRVSYTSDFWVFYEILFGLRVLPGLAFCFLLFCVGEGASRVIVTDCGQVTQ